MSLAVIDQIKSIAGGDFASNLGIASQIGRVITNDGYSIGGLKVDTITEEDHESTVVATSQPVQQGIKATDHVYANADTLTISGIISDMEVTGFIDIGAIGFANTIKGYATGDNVTKSSKSWKKIKEMQRAAKLLTVKTNLQDYKNMLIISASVKQDKKTANEIRFTLNLRELIIVGTEKYTGNINKLVGRTSSTGKTTAAQNSAITSNRLSTPAGTGLQPGQSVGSASQLRTILNKVTGP